jgi:hypothetical protein
MMATLTNQERNVLRKVVRLLDLRGNQGIPAYEEAVTHTLSGVREMLQPTEKYALHVPDDYDFKLNVAWYETSPDGIKHLYLQVIEPVDTAPPTVEEGDPQ